MKTTELLEGRWVAKSLDGVERRFKDAKDAEAWKQVTAKKQRQPKQKDWWTDYDDEEEKAKPKVDLWDLWTRFEAAVSSSFPDGDPIGQIASYMRHQRLTIDDLDAAVKEHGGADSAHGYLAQMWDDLSADAEHDAMRGAHGENYDDKWFTQKNPWK